MISGKELRALPWNVSPRNIRMDSNTPEISSREDYYAIVYKYIFDSDHALDNEAVQAQLDILWLAGFYLVPLRADN